MKANIYIDGGNLYFGMLKGHSESKWLDIIPVGTHGNTIHRPSAWTEIATPEC